MIMSAPPPSSISSSRRRLELSEHLVRMRKVSTPAPVSTPLLLIVRLMRVRPTRALESTSSAREKHLPATQLIPRSEGLLRGNLRCASGFKRGRTHSGHQVSGSISCSFHDELQLKLRQLPGIIQSHLAHACPHTLLRIGPRVDTNVWREPSSRQDLVRVRTPLATRSTYQSTRCATQIWRSALAGYGCRWSERAFSRRGTVALSQEDLLL